MVAEASVECRGLFVAEQARRCECRLVDVEHIRHQRRSRDPVFRLDAFMEGGNVACQPVQQWRRQRSLHRPAVEKSVLVKAAHFHHGVDEPAGTVERQPAIGFPGDAPDSPIELRRSPAVELQLAFAGGQSQFRVREIDIGEPDRPLQLYGRIPGQEEDGDMRGQHLGAIGCPWPEHGRFQEGQNFRGGVGHVVTPLACAMLLTEPATFSDHRPAYCRRKHRSRFDRHQGGFRQSLLNSHPTESIRRTRCHGRSNPSEYSDTPH